MANINSTIDIKADPEHVFELVENVELRMRLNPRIKIHKVLKMTPGSMKIGCRFYYRMTVDNKTIEHYTTCVAYRPGRLLEMVSDGNPVFNVKLSCQPIPGGTRLIHEESFQREQIDWPLASTESFLGELVFLVLGKKWGFKKSYDSVVADEKEMLASLESMLEEWMAKIKNHLETRHGVLYA